jgi:hypothetical protein
MLKGLAEANNGGAKMGIAVVSVVLPLSEIGAAATGADDAVTGFRAVSRAEADDIATNGFRPHPLGRSMESKWFSVLREGAEWFRNNISDLEEVVEARVPRSVYERSYRHPNIDGTGPGFCVECGDLPLITPVLK